MGLATTSLSALALFVALVIATLDTTGGADRLGSLAAATAPKIVDTSGGPDTDLAWTFAPVLHIEHGEEYGPTGVQSFLAHATESGAEKLRGTRHTPVHGLRAGADARRFSFARVYS
jgi:hypothetical protein